MHTIHVCGIECIPSLSAEGSEYDTDEIKRRSLSFTVWKTKTKVNMINKCRCACIVSISIEIVVDVSTQTGLKDYHKRYYRGIYLLHSNRCANGVSSIPVITSRFDKGHNLSGTFRSVFCHWKGREN